MRSKWNIVQKIIIIYWELGHIKVNMSRDNVEISKGNIKR